jgi:ketosteroid isomerase-like protein
MAEVEKLIDRVLDGYKQAVFDKNILAFIRLYDPKVRVFDAWGTWSYEGTEAWQLAVEAWFTSLGNERVRVTFEDVRSLGSPDLALATATVAYAAVAADGTQLRSMQNRMSWVLKTSGHVLRIVHEHTSAPIGFDDMKAILHKPGSR